MKINDPCRKRVKTLLIYAVAVIFCFVTGTVIVHNYVSTSKAIQYIDNSKERLQIIGASTETPKRVECPKDILEEIAKDIAITRNKLSRQLNALSKKIGQLQCEKSKTQVNEQGGYCKQVSKEHSGQHQTDIMLIETLSEFLKEKSVASFGDGPGAYKREMLKLGQVKSYDAYDGAPFCEETSEGRVKFLDLTIPQYGLPFYDWILSLEVAEHIPSQFESVYLDNIFRHAKEGVILSWAVPGQAGLSHVNTQTQSYVIRIMKANGFEWDKKLSNRLKRSSSLWWLQRNTNAYIRTGYSNFKNESTLSQWYI